MINLKSVGIVIVGLVCFSLQSALAQEFYTQNGTDPTWKSIIDGEQIPIGVNSTKGIAGSVVDVNNALTEKLTYGDRPIEKEISIHTPGNSVIRRKDFPKWTRWYQEDGNTQVFRMFKGEYNVRNTRKAAARVESFSNHKWKRGYGWQQWSGTYTMVQPVGGSIFQVKNRINDWAVMLTTNANGDIRFQPRNGKHRIVARGMKGKSFDLRVRDDGHNYEVYIDSKKVGDGAYHRPEGETAFRWGMYYGKSIPKSDALIFVTGAAVNDRLGEMVSVGQGSGDVSMKSRPNIIFMLTDDQRSDDLGCMGNQIIQTPNLDELAAGGVVFDNAFVTTAICCSSRASILTGQHMRRHQIYDFATPLSSEAMDNTYPVLLRKSGYRTGFLGKMAIGSPSEEIRHLSLPADKFDFWFGFPQSINFRQTVDGKSRFLTTLLADKAVEFLKTNPVDKPFCLSISFKEPHGPWNYFDPNAPNPYEDMEIPPPASYTRQDYESQPGFLRESLNGSGEWPKDPHRRFIDNARTCYRLITGMDAAVGRIMATLEELGLDDNTIVIFTSDHGSLRGTHGLFGKWNMYEESIRAPLIVRDPRLPADSYGTRRDQMVLNIDLAPTMLAMGGVAIPNRMQGCDFSPLLRNESIRWRAEWFYEHTYNTRSPRRPIAKSEGVRTADWKYIRYIEHDPPYEQLFDLRNDPGERRNLTGLAEHAEVLADMRARWKRLGREAR